jgi:hypothetical protein
MKTLFSASLIFLLISFTSCFELIEQVFIKKDGSGNLQLTLNLSKSKTKINSIRQMKAINGHDIPTEGEVRQKIRTLEKDVAKTKGVTGVKTTMDFDNYIVTMSCNFTNANLLNGIVKNIAKTGTEAKYLEKSYNYDAANNSFERLNKISLKSDYNKLSNADKEVFATANYTAIYKFENTINTASNKDAKISPSKKAIMLQQNVLDIIMGKKSIENKINLSK